MSDYLNPRDAFSEHAVFSLCASAQDFAVTSLFFECVFQRETKGEREGDHNPLKQRSNIRNVLESTSATINQGHSIKHLAFSGMLQRQIVFGGTRRNAATVGSKFVL